MLGRPSVRNFGRCLSTSLLATSPSLQQKEHQCEEQPGGMFPGSVCLFLRLSCWEIFSLQDVCTRVEFYPCMTRSASLVLTRYAACYDVNYWCTGMKWDYKHTEQVIRIAPFSIASLVLHWQFCGSVCSSSHINGSRPLLRDRTEVVSVWPEDEGKCTAVRTDVREYRIVQCRSGTMVSSLHGGWVSGCSGDVFVGVGFVYLPQCCQVSQPRYMPEGETQPPLKRKGRCVCG